MGIEQRPRIGVILGGSSSDVYFSGITSTNITIIYAKSTWTTFPWKLVGHTKQTQIVPRACSTHSAGITFTINYYTKLEPSSIGIIALFLELRVGSGPSRILGRGVSSGIGGVHGKRLVLPVHIPFDIKARPWVHIETPDHRSPHGERNT